jgi:hypothetical protein
LDNYGNYATSTPVSVTVDNLVPVITMNGGNATLYTGQTYTDLGATALDARQGDLTSNIVTVSHVNTSAPGTYTVTYDVSDDQGNAAAEAVRTVVVQPVSGGGPIAGSNFSYPGQAKPRPQIVYPDGHIVFLDISTSTTTTTQTVNATNQNVTTNPSKNISSYNFTRNLSLHATGADVKSLQQFLNTHGFVIATSGAGSPGKETDLFGSLTYKALMKFQKSVGLPATGFFGPMTRAVVGK